MKTGRNDPCSCGSGLKFKKCCYLDPLKQDEINRPNVFSPKSRQIKHDPSIPIKIYKLKVVLTGMGYEDIENEVSRTFEVTGKNTLYHFHQAIQHAFNWDNDHLFGFYFGELFDREDEYSGDPMGGRLSLRGGIGIQPKSAEATEIRDLTLTESSSFFYMFDFGDQLVHTVEVEEIRDKNDTDNIAPTLVDKVGIAPSQYGYDD